MDMLISSWIVCLSKFAFVYQTKLLGSLHYLTWQTITVVRSNSLQRLGSEPFVVVQVSCHCSENQSNEKHCEQLGKAVAYIPFSFFFLSFSMCRFMYYTNEGATSSKSKIEFHVEYILCMLWFAFGRCVVSTCSVWCVRRIQLKPIKVLFAVIFRSIDRVKKTDVLMSTLNVWDWMRIRLWAKINFICFSFEDYKVIIIFSSECLLPWMVRIMSIWTCSLTWVNALTIKRWEKKARFLGWALLVEESRGTDKTLSCSCTSLSL